MNAGAVAARARNIEAQRIKREARLEDLEFMNEHKVGAGSAAKRLGLSTRTLYAFMVRHDYGDLWAALTETDKERE